CAELAEATQTHPASLYRVMRALASSGIFVEEVDGRFGLTPLAETLRSDVPDCMRAFAVMVGESPAWQAWGNVLHSVRTGQSAFEHVFGLELFQYFSQHPDAAAVFDAG